MSYLKLYLRLGSIVMWTVTLSACNQKAASVSLGEKKDTSALSTQDSVRTPAERFTHLSVHYWDRLDLTDTTLIHQPDILEQAFVDYLANILSHLSPESVKENIGILMNRISQTPVMQNYIVDLFDRYLYAPDSPYRNEELYIPYLEVLTKLPAARTEDTITGEYRLKMARKNRPGKQATDFVYIDRYGNRGRLSDIESHYVLLMFYDPDCEHCHQSIQNLNSLAVSADPRLKIVAIYPDENVEEWKKKKNDFPVSWINGYSPDGEIIKKEWYDVRGYPVFYLLDKDRTVILKDVPEIYLLEYLNQTLLLGN